MSGLRLDVVTDRVDELADGRQLIIDYKSKKKTDLPYKGWFDERIEEPQLPLYVTTNEVSTAGVVLAGVNGADMGYRGVCAESGLVPGIKAFAETKEASGYSGWDGLKGEWSRQLELLAAEVLAGRADVSPKNPNRDCKYCALPALCRIHEQQGLGTWEDEG
jgi:ATP-dependent helicase/nuclease subunit B